MRTASQRHPRGALLAVCAAALGLAGARLAGADRSPAQASTGRRALPATGRHRIRGRRRTASAATATVPAGAGIRPAAGEV